MEHADSSVCMERRCLCAGALAALSMAALGCGGGGGGGSTPAPASTPTPTATPTAPTATTETKASMLAQPNGSAHHFGTTSACGAGTAQGILLVRDANGIFAISASCLHLGGQIQASSGGFSCPCHGSTYDANGTVTGGPAPVGSTLAHYLVRESTPGGTLEVDTTSQVSPSTRLS